MCNDRNKSSKININFIAVSDQVYIIIKCQIKNDFIS